MNLEKMDPEEREALIAEAKKPPVRNAEEEKSIMATVRHVADKAGCTVVEFEKTKHFTIGIYGEKSEACAEALCIHFKFVKTPLSGDGSDSLNPITIQKWGSGKIHIYEEPEINLNRQKLD